jgi:hypothetical protein
MRPQAGVMPLRPDARANARPIARLAGPPAPAFAGPPGLVQARGGKEAIQVDATRLGLVNGGGVPLPAPLLAKMEAAFGADFSAVRVHVGSQAARIGAVAFTTGEQLYFALGRYQPESIQGQQLIGHELAHVIQQRQGRVRATGPGVAVVQDRALEAEADRLGMRAAMHRAPKGRGTAAQPKLAPHAGRGALPWGGAGTQRSTNRQSGNRQPAWASPRGAMPPRGTRMAVPLQPSRAPGAVQMRNAGPRVIQRVTLLGGFAFGGPEHADYNRVNDSLSRGVLREMIYLDEHSTLTYQTGVVGGDLGLTVFEVQIAGAWNDLDDICSPLSANYALGLQLEADMPMRTVITADPALHGVVPHFNRVDSTLVHEITVHAWHAAGWLRKLRSRAYQPAQLRSAWRSSNLLNPDQEHDAFGLGQNRGYGMTAQNLFDGLGLGGAPFQADVRSDQNAHNPGLVPLNLPGGGTPEFYL